MEISFDIHRSCNSIKIDAYRNKRSIAFAKLFLHEHPAQNCAWLTEIYVYPKFRGRGIESKVLLQVNGIVSDLSLPAFLYAYSSELPQRILLRFYAKHGWTQLNNLLSGAKSSYMYYLPEGVQKDTLFLVSQGIIRCMYNNV